MDENVQRYIWSFHGTGIEVSGSAAVVAALSSRLGGLPATAKQGGKLHFDFLAAGALSGHRIERPQGQGRAFYIPAIGEATYFPTRYELYLDYGGRVRALCRLKEGHCSISLLEPEADQLWLGTHPLFTIPLLEMLKRRGKFNLHAAAFAIDGSCLLLPGTTGAGKSTLSIALLRAGLDFLGDDMIFLEESDGLQVLGFPEKLDVTDSTALLFEELKQLVHREKRAGWPKHEIDASEFFPSRIAPTAKPKAIVFPCIGHVAESTLSRISVEEAFLELAPSVLLTEPNSTQAHIQVLAQLANTAPAYRLSTGRDFDRVALMLSELIA